MPQALPIVIAGAMGALGPALMGASMGAIIGGFVISAALSGLSMLLQPHPSAPSAAHPSATARSARPTAASISPSGASAPRLWCVATRSRAHSSPWPTVAPKGWNGCAGWSRW